jgi:hypothetical protein
MYGKTRAGIGLPLLVDSEGQAIMKSGGGKYADAALNGRLFYAANQTPVATSTTLNTGFTGLGLCNPSGSGKVIIVHKFGYALDQAAAGEAVLALATTTSSGFAAAITAQCCRHAYATSIAYVDDGATIVAPVITLIIGSLGQGADTTQFMPPFTLVDLDGCIVLDPGRAVVTDTTVATGATSIQFSFLWDEIDE